MAVLEAFVYDPLITWRLIQHDGDNRRAERTSPPTSRITFMLTSASGVVMNPDRGVDLAGSAATGGGGAHRRMRPDENDIFNGAPFRAHASLAVLYSHLYRGPGDPERARARGVQPRAEQAHR